MDCPCGREKCTCQKSICTLTEGCLCSSCFELLNEKCGMCGLHIPATYLSEASSIVDEKPSNCQCFLTKDHGVNISGQAQASADCEAVHAAIITPVIPRSNPLISNSSLMYPMHSQVVSSSTGKRKRQTLQEKITMEGILRNRGGSKNDEGNVEQEGEIKAAQKIEISLQRVVYQSYKSTSCYAATTTANHPHQQQYESRGTDTFAGLPIPPPHQNNKNTILNHFPAISHSSHQRYCEAPRMGTPRYNHPHTYATPILNPSYQNRVGFMFNPSQRTSFHYPDGYRYEDLTLNLPERNSDQQQQLDRLQQAELPSYSPYQNMVLVPPSRHSRSLLLVRFPYPSIPVPQRRPSHSHFHGNRPVLPESSREKVERWLREQENFLNEYSPVSPLSCDNREHVAELPISGNNESTSSEGNIASISEYFKAKE